MRFSWSDNRLRKYHSMIVLHRIAVVIIAAPFIKGIIILSVIIIVNIIIMS